MGGAILPKLMGYVADQYTMCRGFIVPLFCFVFIALYAWNWPKFSKAESLHEVKTSGGHEVHRQSKDEKDGARPAADDTAGR
jgi:sugar phosphate permease